MKVNKIAIIILIQIINMIDITAQNIIPADSTHLLSMEQKQTIEFVKKQLNQDKTGLELPLEVNYLLGDTITKTNYKVKPKWEDAYFIKADSVVMIVPLYNDSINISQSQLKVTALKDCRYSKVVETIIAFDDSSVEQFCGILIYSSVMGNLEKIYRFEKGECVEIIENRFSFVDKPGKNPKQHNKVSKDNNLYKKVNDRTETAKRRMSWYPPIGIPISTTPDPIKK